MGTYACPTSAFMFHSKFFNSCRIFFYERLDSECFYIAPKVTWIRNQNFKYHAIKLSVEEII